MNKQQIADAILAGKPVVVVEYRSFKIDEIRYNDKKTGARVKRDIVKHGLELAGKPCVLTEWLPDGTNLEIIKPQFRKGENCVLEIEELAGDRDTLTARGSLAPYEATPAK